MSNVDYIGKLFAVKVEVTPHGYKLEDERYLLTKYSPPSWLWGCSFFAIVQYFPDYGWILRRTVKIK